MSANKPEYLVSLESDVKRYKDAIKEASEAIVNEGVSDYPVFIAHRGAFPIGELILDHKELETQWSIFASTTEELIKAGIIEMEKARFFVTQYKPVNEYMCLFVVASETDAQFIFMPY